MTFFPAIFCRRPFLFLFVLLLIGCGQEGQTVNDSDTALPIPEQFQGLENLTVYPADSEPLYEISMGEVASYGSTNEVLIGRMGPVRINDSLVFISDHDQLTVHVFHFDGRYVKSIGREGRGPGEFLSLSNLLFHNDHLYVYDRALKRVNSFNLTDFKNGTTLNLHPGNKLDFEELIYTFPLLPVHIYEDGSFLVRYRTMRTPMWEPEDDTIDGAYHYLILNREGTQLEDKIYDESYAFLLSGTNLNPIVPFDSEPLITISDSGGFVTADSRDFLLKTYDAEGTYRSSFYYPVSKKGLTLSEARDTVIKTRGHDTDMLNALNSLDFPATWPALERISMDDEKRLWISTIIEDTRFRQWWVVDEQGKLLTRFKWEANKNLLKVINDNMYILERSDIGEHEDVIKKYRFHLEEI